MQNQQNGMCAQRRLRSACASAQSVGFVMGRLILVMIHESFSISLVFIHYLDTQS